MADRGEGKLQMVALNLEMKNALFDPFERFYPLWVFIEKIVIVVGVSRLGSASFPSYEVFLLACCVIM